MPVTNEQARALGRRLVAARGRILAEHGFYGLLLMHMRFAVGDELDTAWVSSDTITFNPEFSDKLSASELCFVLEHEVLHAALGHLERQGARDQFLWNLACDIVVNSNIKHSNGDDPMSITLRCGHGESYHLAPNGEEGWHYSADEVYEMLLRNKDVRKKVAIEQDPGEKDDGPGGANAQGTGDATSDAVAAAKACGRGSRWDWHIVDDGSDPATEADLHDTWAQRLASARESISVRDPSNQRGLVPACAERRLEELKGASADWRLLLDEFVQEDVCDYSFTSPDRRFPDSPFVLPGFTEADTIVRDVLFMVDTSGSVSDAALATAFGEVKSAIEQFERRLCGWLGFFDAMPYEPARFEDVADLDSIKPKGGGGTRFEVVFEGVDRWLEAEDLSCIVILTDGYAPCPAPSVTRGVPVLWLIEGEGPTPPWGKVARVRLDESR